MRIALGTLLCTLVLTASGGAGSWTDDGADVEKELKKFAASTVGEVMTSDCPKVASTDTVERVATVMHDEGVSHVPVVDGDRVVGMVARGDLVRHLADTT